MTANIAIVLALLGVALGLGALHHALRGRS